MVCADNWPCSISDNTVSDSCNFVGIHTGKSDGEAAAGGSPHPSEFPTLGNSCSLNGATISFDLGEDNGPGNGGGGGPNSVIFSTH